MKNHSKKRIQYILYHFMTRVYEQEVSYESEKSVDDFLDLDLDVVFFILDVDRSIEQKILS